MAESSRMVHTYWTFASDGSKEADTSACKESVAPTSAPTIARTSEEKLPLTRCPSTMGAKMARSTSAEGKGAPRTPQCRKARWPIASAPEWIVIRNWK
eukprot:scaffold33956_cov29-Tisochrysis_lutea.AAC.4